MGRDFHLILFSLAPILALISIRSLIQRAEEIQQVSERLYWQYKINVSHSSLPRLAPCLSAVVAVQPLAVIWSFLPGFAGVSPTYGFLGIIQKAFVDFGGYMFCHPGYSATRNYVECNSANVTCDILRGVLNWNFFVLFYTLHSLYCCVGPSACMIPACSPHESLCCPRSPLSFPGSVVCMEARSSLLPLLRGRVLWQKDGMGSWGQ